MNLSSQQGPPINKHLENCFLMPAFSENRLITLFYSSLKKGASAAPLHGCTEKIQNEINELEKLVYNSHYLCPTLHQSVVSKILSYDEAILAVEKYISVNEFVWPKEHDLYRKRLQKIQQRIQIVLLYLHV
ncbi:hypothetical protein F0365_09685 [Nonlabens sp. Ci31]|uniref:hypothetical protein n=1 Tax=Nonlabens sp. Ci31 TaxID=2608253 RepID=UPI001463F7AD|nr:hypothetical protein [Nonlabens sp. Ci31]QJP34644.1 hypothetical protein F0365_09685 [Nonlabens sp. Ci31]